MISAQVLLSMAALCGLMLQSSSKLCRHLYAGDLILSFRDTALGAETCEELFTPHAPLIALALNGVEIISNGSGSHHQLRSAHARVFKDVLG